jgi:hypothetical protein
LQIRQAGHTGIIAGRISVDGGVILRIAALPCFVLNVRYANHVQERRWDTGMFTNATFAQRKERNWQQIAQSTLQPKPRRRKLNGGLRPGVL